MKANNNPAATHQTNDSPSPKSACMRPSSSGFIVVRTRLMRLVTTLVSTHNTDSGKVHMPTSGITEANAKMSAPIPPARETI